MNAEFLSALERIEREKGISKEVLFEAIESALASAARKVIDDPNVAKEDITVTIDKMTGEITVFSEGEEVQSDRFGRIAAQTAKQVIIQKIREAEREVITDKFQKKVGTIISGSVHRFEKGNIIVEVDSTEAILPKSEQIPREKFRQGEGIRGYLLKVEKGTSGPQIVLSRGNDGFVKKLFELEVPEISQGIVEIKGIAREVGERTKISVYSKDEKIDPVGACVGMRGTRVRDIVKELHGERIDIIRWYDDIREYVPSAVSPAEILRMAIDRENKQITLTVPKDQLSLLIGKKGRNIRLASKLLGWELKAESMEEEIPVAITSVDGIGKKTCSVLEGAGFETANKVIKLSAEELSELEGIGPKTAEKVLTACNGAVEEAKKKAREKEAEEAEEKKREKEEASEEPKTSEEPFKLREEETQEESLEEVDEKQTETESIEKIDEDADKEEKKEEEES